MLKNSDTWRKGILSSATRKALPIATNPGLKITGKRVIDIATNGEEQANCIIKLSQRYATAASAMVMDLSVEAEAFGSPVTFNQDEIPTISKNIVDGADSIRKLDIPEVGSGRTGEYLKAASIAAKSITDRPVFGGMIGPYSLAGRLFDITEMMTLILIDPEVAHMLLIKCTEFLTGYARAYKKTGINGILIAEPAAGLLHPEACQEFSSLYVKTIVDSVQDSEFSVILHNCGNTVPLMQSLLTTDCMIYHVGNSVNILDILSQVPEDIIIAGNLDPVKVFKSGTPEKIYEKTTALLESTKKYSNFLISSGCDIPPGTSLENMDSFFKAVNDYNSKIIMP